MNTLCYIVRMISFHFRWTLLHDAAQVNQQRKKQLKRNCHLMMMIAFLCHMSDSSDCGNIFEDIRVFFLTVLSIFCDTDTSKKNKNKLKVWTITGFCLSTSKKWANCDAITKKIRKMFFNIKHYTGCPLQQNISFIQTKEKAMAKRRLLAA